MHELTVLRPNYDTRFDQPLTVEVVEGNPLGGEEYTTIASSKLIRKKEKGKSTVGEDTQLPP